MKKYINLFLLVLFFITAGCSVKAAGGGEVYQEPASTYFAEISTLKSIYDNEMITSVDGKPVNMQAFKVKPGAHEVTLCNPNHKVVLKVNFKAGHAYFVGAKGHDVWIENSHGVRVSTKK